MNSQYKDDLSHIRSMMEKSSRFVSLSGLSGVFAGIFALLGAGYAYYLMQQHHVNYFDENRATYSYKLIIELGSIAVGVLILSIGFGIFFTLKKSKNKSLPIWNKVTQELLINLAIPLLAGGIFCLGLLYHGISALVAPSMLIFYGLALVNASKFTYGDVRWLGYLEIMLGCISLFFVGKGLIFWAIGFGILHIVYGIVMFNKYDK